MAIIGEKWSQQPLIKIGDNTYVCTVSGNGETFISALINANDFASSSGGTINGPLTITASGYTVELISQDGILAIKDQVGNTLFSIDKDGIVKTNGTQLVDYNTALAFSIAL